MVSLLCHTCEGYGRYRGKVCPECNGGRVFYKTGEKAVMEYLAKPNKWRVGRWNGRGGLNEKS